MTITCPQCSADVVVPGPTAGCRPDEIPITTVDLPVRYEVLAPVFFSVGTRGGMRAEFERFKRLAAHRLSSIQKKGQITEARSVDQFVGVASLDSDGDVDLAGQFSGASFTSDDLDIAFQIAIGQLQMRASYLGANAIVGFRYDIDLDSNAGLLNFFATAYGTAVKTGQRSDGPTVEPPRD